MMASHASWEIHFGPVPDRLWVLHSCDTPPCVNPSHLFLGNHQDNESDKDAKDRRPVGERHPKAKLTDADVLEIQRAYDNAVGWHGHRGLAAQLAARFSVTASHVSMVGCRRLRSIPG